MQPNRVGLTSRTYDVDDFAAAQEFYHSNGWSDGLPVVPPIHPNRSDLADRDRRYQQDEAEEPEAGPDRVREFPAVAQHDPVELAGIVDPAERIEGEKRSASPFGWTSLSQKLFTGWVSSQYAACMTSIDANAPAVSQNTVPSFNRSSRRTRNRRLSGSHSPPTVNPG
jgi:hypothetical protein